MDLGLAGKIAIVTGSTRGLGLAIATALVQEGCQRHHLRPRRSRARRRRRASADAAGRRRAGPARCRPTSRPTRASPTSSCARSRPSAAWTSSSTTSASPRAADIVDTTDAEWQEAFDQTLFPAVRASRMAVPQMRRRGGGAIVMIASIWGRESGGRMTYNAVKAAEISLAKAMAQQLAQGQHPRQQRGARARFAFRADRGTSGCRKIPKGWPSSSGGSCRSGDSAAPKRSGRSSRSSSRRARAGSAGQVCPLTAASHAP